MWGWGCCSQERELAVQLCDFVRELEDFVTGVSVVSLYVERVVECVYVGPYQCYLGQYGSLLVRRVWGVEVSRCWCGWTPILGWFLFGGRVPVVVAPGSGVGRG